MIVRFATLCDHCGKRSPEYHRWETCSECLLDTCPDCRVPGSSSEDERNECICKPCHQASQPPGWLVKLIEAKLRKDQRCTC